MLILNPERAQAQLDELDEQRVRAEARYSEVLAALVNQRDRADAAEAALNAARTELNRLHASEYPGGSRSPQGLHRHIALTVSRANGSARGETSISIAKIPGIVSPLGRNKPTLCVLSVLPNLIFRSENVSSSLLIVGGV